MRCLPPRRGLLVALLVLPLVVGCDRKRPEPELSFESSSDTTGLSRGADVMASFEPYRMSNGALRARGRMRLPDSTKVEIAVMRPGGRTSVAMSHAFVLGGTFDSPPMLGDTGPLPHGAYHYEVRVHFNDDWQTPRVLRETDRGLALRGPGMTRARNGEAVLFLTREGTL
jgi:hypothetical protein